MPVLISICEPSIKHHKGHCFMSLKGQLETFYFPTLLQLLYQEKKTGILQVRDGDNNVKIFVKDGNIAHASSSQEGRRLGRLLRDKGVVSAKELQECLRRAKETKKKIGQVLIAQKYISAERLRGFLRQQAREIIYDVFLWKTGRFEYKDVSVNIEAKPVTLMNTMEIILEASRRIDEWSVIKKQIPDDNLVFTLAKRTEKKQKSKLTKREWRILSLMDGSRTVRQVAEESGYEELAAHKIVHSLIASGFIKESKVPRGKKREGVDYSRIVKIYIDILQVIHKHLKAEIGKRVFTLFEECKAQLPPRQRSIFENLDMKKAVWTNMLSMLKVIDTFQNSEQGLLFLTHGFNVFLQGILQREAQLLGVQMTRKTLQEVGQALSYWQEREKESDKRIGTLREIQRIMEQTSQRMNDKGKEKKRPR